MTAGVLAHCYGKLPLAELAKRVGDDRFPYVQLALSKAIADLDCGPGKLSPGLACAIGEAFDREGVKIAVLGCYVNLTATDAAELAGGIERFKEHIRHARNFGASIVATETGIPKPGDDPENNWRSLHAALQAILEEAEKWGVFVGIEPANRHLVDTPAKLAGLFEPYPTKALGAVIDPCNLLTSANWREQDRILRDAFERLGERALSLHAKDVAVQADGGVSVVAAGQGKLNYELFMALADKYKPKIHVTLERTEPSEMREAAAYVRQFRQQVAAVLTPGKNGAGGLLS